MGKIDWSEVGAWLAVLLVIFLIVGGVVILISVSSHDKLGNRPQNEWGWIAICEKGYWIPEENIKKYGVVDRMTPDEIVLYCDGNEIPVD